MWLRIVSFLGAVSLTSLLGAGQSMACGFGLKDFACCESASFPGAPESRFGSGCAISRADATTRCVGMSAGRPDFRVEFGSSQCRSGTGGGTVTGHACSIARRGNNSFTYYYFNSNGSLSQDQLCARARDLNNSGYSPTHSWYTTFNPNKLHKAIAECENGNWVAYDYGAASIQKVNDIRKAAGGKGCLFKVDKSWNP